MSAKPVLWRDLRRLLAALPIAEARFVPCPTSALSLRIEARLTGYVSIDRLRQLDRLLGGAGLAIEIRTDGAYLSGLIPR